MIENVDVPAGKSGDWEIKKFSIKKEDVWLFNLRLIRDDEAHRQIPEGDYTQLVYDNKEVVMSDTPAEKYDHKRFVRKSTGKVLLAGLGLGMVLNAVALKPEVTKVTVIELSSDVINLCWDHYKKKFGDKIELIQSDILEWKPPKGDKIWDCAWFDIWNEGNTDNWEQYKLLMRRYGRKAEYKDCWMRDELLRQLREEKRYA